MIQILANWLASALAIFIVARFVPGVALDSFTTALVVALVLGILNALIKPILLILTLPINILTLGLFTFVINALMLYLASHLVAGFRIWGFAPALIASILLWIINSILHLVIFPIRTTLK